MFKDNVIHLCSFCGEKTSGTLCPSCRTKESRKTKIIEQLAIEEENLIKGRKIPKTLFRFEREKVLELYNL